MSPITTPSRSTLRSAQSGARRTVRPRFRLRPLVLAMALATGAPVAWRTGAMEARAQVLPRGPVVVQGQASVVSQGNLMTVTNSANALLNWQSFSVGAGNTVRFNQPNASSQVMNRVVGTDPSNILGNISSNGKVWLLNPYGVIFGRDARIDVAGLLVSTLNISDDDWRAQRLNLTSTGLAGGASATVVNQGELRTTSGGRVMLIGGEGGVSNSGLIEAPDGQVILAAGRSVDLVDSGLPTLAVRVAAPAGEALNLGTLSAGNGRIDLQAAIVNQQGVVRADSLGGRGGEVVLVASQSLRTGGASVTSADGASGGRISAESGDGTTLLAGELTARGSSGAGGSATLLGRQVGLLAGADVDVSGASGGGNVRVGGGVQGRDSSVRNAEAVYMDAGARIAADATVNGDGGSIVLWSDQATRAYGSLFARGGTEGGNGGFIETSGGWLDARPALIDTTAAKGLAGQWLLDPNDIFIVQSGSDINVVGDPDFTTTGDSAIITTGTIEAALNAGNNVTVTTSNLGADSQPGDITMAAATISVTTPNGGSPVALTLNASRNITLLSSTIESTGSGAPLNLTLNAASGGSFIGTIQIDNSSILSNGGDIAFGGPFKDVIGPNTSTTLNAAVGYDGNGVGVSVARSNIDARGASFDGNITISGASVAQSGVSGLAQGVSIGSGAVLTGYDIDIVGWVDSDGDLSRVGIAVEGGASGASVIAAHSLTLDGFASSNVSWSRPYDGVRISGDLLVQPSSPIGDEFLSITGGLNTAVPAQPDSWGVNILDEFDASGAYTLSIVGSPSVKIGRGQYFGFTASTSGPTTVQATGNDALLFIDNVDFYGSPSALDFIVPGINADIAFNYAYFYSVQAPVSATASGTGGSVTLNYLYMNGGTGDVLLSADTVQGGGSITLSGTAAFSVDADTFTPGQGGFGHGLQVTTPGAITVRADNVTLNNGFTDTVLTSTASGDAITFAGRTAATNVTSFINNAGSGALVTQFGRWQIYAIDPTLNFQSDGLDHTATVYGENYGNEFDYGPDTQTGNLFVFSIAPVLSAGSGTPISRPYNGNNFVEVTNSDQLTGLIAGDLLYGFFDTKDVGAGKPITQLQAYDGVAGRSVYGYTQSPGPLTLIGEITPKLLNLTVTASNKFYDGLIAATVSGSLDGLVGTETLTLGLTGQFADKDAGVGKSVTGTASPLTDGGNGGLASNYQLSSAAFATSADILRKSLTLSGVTAANKAYDGTTTATLSGGSLTGLVGSETLTLTSSGSFANKDAGLGKTVTGTAALGNGTNGGLASNYELASTAVATTADITQRVVTASGFTAANKVYDATTSAALSGGSLAGLVSGELLSLSSTGQFDTANVGTIKDVTVTLALADGAGGLASNYTLASASVATTADIIAKTLTLSGVTAADKTYDGLTTVTLGGSTLTGLVNSETLVVGLTGQFVDKNAGVGKSVTGTASLANGGGGGLASNYQLASPAFATTATIDPVNLTLSGMSAASKTYDGSTAAALSGGTLTGLVGTETLGFSSSGQFDTKDVGVNKTVTATVTLADNLVSGGLAANYTLAGGSVTTSADITQRALTLSGVTAANKVYDGNTTATVAGGSLAGLVGSETLTLSSLNGQFVDKNAGVGKSVTGNVVLSDGSNGGLASNYVLPGDSFATSATITPAALTLSGVTAADKIYDGTTTATVTGGSLSGLVGSETLSFVTGGQFDTKDAGAGKTVTATLVLTDNAASGGLAANYTLASGSGTTTADITQRALTLSGVTAANKIYDGTTAASLTGGSLSGLVGSETLTLSSLNGQFVDKNAGLGKSVTGNVTLTDGGNGGLASNYVLPGDSFATSADITPVALTLTGIAAANKVYDGSAAATLTGGSLTGLVGSEVLGFSTSGQFDTKDVGAAKTVTASVQLTDDPASGGLASNYTLANSGVTTTADITQRALTLSGVTAANKIYDGTTAASLTGGSLNGLVGSETLTLSNLNGQFVDKNAGIGKAVTGTASLADGTNGGLASNYALSNGSVATTADITPRGLSVAAATAADKAFDGNTSATITSWTLAGVLGAEQVGVATGSGVFSDPSVGAGKPVTATASTLAGADARNYALAQPVAITTASITAGTGPLPEPLPVPERVIVETQKSVVAVLTQPTYSTPTTGRTVDVMQAVRLIAGGTTFGMLDIGTMSQDALAALLVARERYKKSVFADALRQLEEDPTLADAPACETIEEADTGACLLTAEVKERARAQVATAEGRIPAPTTVPGAVPVPSPAAQAPVAVAPVPAVAPPLPVASASPRAVLTAALPQIQRKVAVVIGVDRYDDGTIPTLANAVGDARAIGKVLESQMGYETVVLENATRKSVLAALNRLAIELGPKDSVMVYYAGHGELVESTKLGYWQLADSDAKRPQTWLSNADIGRMLAQFEASQVALISDSCYSGSLVTNQRIRAAVGTVDPEQLLSRKTVVVMSSGGSEPVADAGKQGHSPFAWSLMNNLKQLSAWQPGGNVFERVRFAVARELPQRPQYGAFAAAGHQSGGDYLFEHRQFEPRTN